MKTVKIEKVIPEKDLPSYVKRQKELAAKILADVAENLKTTPLSDELTSEVLYVYELLLTNQPIEEYLNKEGEE